MRGWFFVWHGFRCLLMACAVSLPGFGQKAVSGIVLEESTNGGFTPLLGASVFWMNTTTGTTTDSSGYFSIPFPVVDSLQSPTLIVRYLGYESDTLADFSQTNLRVILATAGGKRLQEVTVEGRIPPSFQSLESMNTTIMTSKELMKAACCNLSESFETNPAVEVNYGDALTGAKQIQMLGLSGIYTQITQENLPGIRGLMAGYGLGFTPGPWVESIQVTKGVGSVANGYESMTGQINIELKKPDWSPKTREKLFVNVFANSMGRVEANLNTTQKISKRWFVTHLVHANRIENQVDMNHDHYLDLPTGWQLNGLQRWRYDDGKGTTAQLGVQAMRDYRMGGHHAYRQNRTLFGTETDNRQWQAFGKTGYIFPQKKYKSIGIMASYTSNEVDYVIGMTQYRGSQQTAYTNLIYQSILGSTNLTFRVGGSFRWDRYQEKFQRNTTGVQQLRFERTEVVPGVFAEFTWKPAARLTTVAGLRADGHNLFGFWATPRLHVKFDASEKSAIRLTAGQGRRVANILAENTSLFASSRRVEFPATDGGTGLYGVPATSASPHTGGLRPEVAWNYGLGWNHAFTLGEQPGTLSIDAYRTDFQNQVVVDMDASATQLVFSNLDGKSYSNAIQLQADYEPIKRLDVRLAYKWLDVWQTYHGQRLERPFVARHRAFINLAYATRSKWKLDATVNWNGPKRIPTTQANPESLRFPERSPAYATVNAQIAKGFYKNLEVYLGGENLTDFRQQRLINDPENPFGNYFDASLVWGPVVGRMVYAGLRWSVR